MMKKQDLRWRASEEAVARFVAAMDPGATVSHDIRLPDRDTKRPRQIDVWVEARLCGLLPIKVHISCKRLKRKLHQGDIDTFIGELRSSGAHKGVIFSHSGFGQAALEKAQSIGICCCKLYENEPAELPERLVFDSYCCFSYLQQIKITPFPVPGHSFVTWSDVLEFPVSVSDMERWPIADLLAEEYKRAEGESVRMSEAEGGFPREFVAALPALTAHDYGLNFSVSVSGKWKIYRASAKAILLDGAYNFTENLFHGQQFSPWIDRLGPHLGPGWEDVAEPPELAHMTTVLSFYNSDIRSILLEGFGPLQIGVDQDLDLANFEKQSSQIKV